MNETELNVLCIDTTTEYIVMSLQKGEKKSFYISEKGCKKHNSILLTLVDTFLGDNDLSLADIDVFGVAVGPGSFTGIRVGVATVNAFALALGKKIVAVTTLELPVKDDDTMTLLDCKHDNFYCGIFTHGTVEYLALCKEETEKYKYKKIYMNGTYPEELLEKCVKKINEGQFVTQARPLYIKRSSAEIECGIEC